ENPQAILQDYADYLAQKNLSADTIHTYISFPCVFFNIPMSEINKPKRMAASISRSRENGNNPQGVQQESELKYARLVAFQKCVGIRRAELAKLTGDNFKQDENGNWCIEVKKGKGGKYQLQRILPDDVDFVGKYFDGSTSKVFSADEMNNKIDLHAMRGANARNAYEIYLKRCDTSAGRQRLQQELIDRYVRYNKKYIKNGCRPAELAAFQNEMQGIYKLRGDCAAIAKQKERPLTYDKTALMAVSVFHLSHWRCDVTVRNYMLA
ncbi:MAG: hypothetical protein RR612_07130, partial [Oscillospiraceae bacterium]